jgi:transposase
LTKVSAGIRPVAVVDFGFIHRKVKPLYGRRGNPSVDPVVLLKLMFLLFYEQVPSERALMERLPERLDWLWFCGYDLDDRVPNHSVISKARARWGVEVFSDLFREILDQCIAAGLVDGRLIHADSSVLAANADKTKGNSGDTLLFSDT